MYLSAFAYNESKINKKIHATAIHFVIMSVALLQFFMIVFSVIRSLDTEGINIRSKVAIGLFILTINICSAHIWSNTCRKVSPIRYEDVLLANDPNDGNDQVQIKHKSAERINLFLADFPTECFNTSKVKHD